MSTRATIERIFSESLAEAGTPPPSPIPDNLVLLESGLDSLGFAILVTRLEVELGYDPFTLMTDPVYPRTFAEFIEIYLKYAPKGS